MGFIYKITNKINNKSYIGKTARTIEMRWKEHQRNITKYPNLPLYRALLKYGIVNFEVVELEECNNELLDERENYWIKFYNTYSDGYNCTLGGEGGLGDYSECINDIAERYQKGERLDKLCKEYTKSYTGVRRELEFLGVEVNIHAGPDKLSKKIYAINPLSNEIVSVYKSISEAARTICLEGHNYKSIVNHICKQKDSGRVCHGFCWYTEMGLEKIFYNEDFGRAGTKIT